MYNKYTKICITNTQKHYNKIHKNMYNKYTKTCITNTQKHI